MGALLFSHFRVTNLKLINEKNYLAKYCSFKMTWTASFYYFFLYLACFVVSTYVIFICYLSMLNLNGLGKFNNIFIYKTTEDTPVAVS